MSVIESTSAQRVVLPDDVVPLRYDLTLEPDLEAFVFKGTVDIEFKVNKSSSKEIILHAKELCFESAEFIVLNQNTVKATTAPPVKAEQIVVNLKETTVKFVFPRTFESNGHNIRLTIRYTGFLNNQMAGFYRSMYQDIDGKTKIMASTQFESLDARRAFPCVDEPAAKAVFGATLVIPSHLHCMSNMPEASCISLSSSKKQVKFMDSPKMSTYLLAFVVGEFDFVQQQTEHGVLVRVYTPPGRASSGLFALDCAVRALDLYDVFFDEHYPLPKLDMVAIGEFAMGAMENWGLCIYREVDLLIDPVKASSNQKQRVATVVTHELGHQWFGNLVTMDWWNGLWLNESFASWAENWATNKLYPEYRMWDQFCTGHLSAALRLDSLKSSHPVDVPIRHAEEVEQVFDAISYCKGASVVRMIKAVLGFKHFQEGLRSYMKKFAYGNTDASDLWRAWEEASGMPVGELMGSWTHQMGFPLVQVVKEDWQADRVTLELEQSWFLSDGSDLNEEEQEKTWTVPITTCTDSGTQSEMTLMREKSATVSISLASPDSWVKLNAGQEVPMRVLPAKEMLKRCESGIESKTMPPSDRAGILTDLYALVKAGKLPPETLIKFLRAYKDESDFIVWEGIAGVLIGLDTVLSDDEIVSAKFQRFAKAMVVPLVDKVGWETQDDDGHLTTLLRGLMLNLLSTFAFDDESVAKEATHRFRAFQENHSDVKTLPSDMRSQVFKIVLKNGGAQEYNDIKSYFSEATDNAERKHVLNALGNTQDPALKLATMEWSTSGEIKLQDFFYVMGSVGRSSKEGREISWKYFQDNFEKIKGMLEKASPSLMDAVIVMCAGSFCSVEKADEIDSFFEAHPLPQNTRKIAQTTESMRANGKFLAVLQASALSNDDFWVGL